jgi:hypothetical protein
MTLRPLLELDASAAFHPPESVADVKVEEREMSLRLAKMQRAIVAHAALCKALANFGVSRPEMPGRLKDAIAKAKGLHILTDTQARWLLFFNSQANEAKHELATMLDMSENAGDGEGGGPMKGKGNRWGKGKRR